MEMSSLRGKRNAKVDAMRRSPIPRRCQIQLVAKGVAHLCDGRVTDPVSTILLMQASCDLRHKALLTLVQA